jgi:hypothetical protein
LRKDAQSRSPAPRGRGSVARRAPRLCLALATVVISPTALACARNAASQRTRASASAAACTQKQYVLKVHPTTIVSNELHRVYVRALLDACGNQTPVRGAGVHLLTYRATTGSQGRCMLDVRLQTGKYLVRLYVRGQAVAHASVSAIPVVAK